MNQDIIDFAIAAIVITVLLMLMSYLDGGYI